MTPLADDIQAMMSALAGVLEPSSLALIFVGVLGGIIVGVIPGLSTTMAVALMIPFTFAMRPEIAMSLLVAVYVGGVSGGLVTAILVRMPGTPAAIASVLDGFPMAQKGQGGKAIGNAIVASLIGTMISGAFLMTLAPLLANFAIRFHFAEYVALGVFALTAVISISGNSLLRGLVTCLLGLLVATIGISVEDGLTRFTFGSDALIGGLGLIPALMGIFAVSQMMHESARGFANEAIVAPRVEGVLPSLNDIRSNLGNYLRSGLIGSFVGIVPALGGGPAGLISYSQARNASKTPELFGTGHVPGVIASETANNATIGGALIIALTLGIPGDPVTAILLGGLMIHGLQPGPQLFQQNPEIVYSIYFTVFFGSICMAVIMLSAARPLSQVVQLPKRFLIPSLFLMASIGTFSMNNRLFDVFVMFGFGVLGYLLDRFRYPLPPFILGIILGPIIEGNFRKLWAADGSPMALFTRPIPLAFLVMSAMFVLYTAVRHYRAQHVLQ